MAYTINRFNGTVLTNVEDGTINTTTDLKLVGKNYSGYGESQNENFLFLLENFAGVNAPTKPISGMIWFDSGTNKLKFYNGTSWKPAGGTEISTTAPAGAAEGDFWWDSNNEQFYVRSASGNWVLIGPQGVGAGFGVTQTKSLTLTDTTGTIHAILATYVEDTVISTISPDTFTPNTASAITGFPTIYAGITLVNSNSGETSTTHRFYGTATNADKLGGLSSSDFVRSTGTTNFSSLVTFSDTGFTLGTGTDLTFEIDLDGITPVFKMNQDKLRIKDSAGNVVVYWDATGMHPGANANGTIYNLGKGAEKFQNVYATTFNGTATQADTLKVGSAYRSAATSATFDSIAARDSAGNLTAVVFSGTATKARYADLAEKYTTGDTDLEPGTAVAVGADDCCEVVPAKSSDICIGVVSTDPAIMMNSEADGQYIALKGRVPVKVEGPVKKGQAVYAWEDGICKTIATTALIGVALETKDSDDVGLVECVLKV